MARCPVCESVRVVIVVAPFPRAFCAKCGARWIQEGSAQRHVQRNGNGNGRPKTAPVAPERVDRTPA
jgi:Zn-finger nucleic acid-binding protein